VNRTNTAVDGNVADEYGIVVLGPHVLLSFDTWKSVDGAVTVIVPGAPVRFAPDKLND
jgi:hypothetical protein